MDTLGGYLKEAREEQGLTYEQLTAKTRIPEKHLQALEEEDYQRLPAKVFTKGFVRSYARTLGLDEEEAVRRFLETSFAYYESTQQEEHFTQIPREDVSRSSLNWKIVAAGCLLIGGLIFFLLPSQQDQPTESPDPQAVSSEAPQEPDVDPTPGLETSGAEKPDPGEPPSGSSIEEESPEPIAQTPPPLPEKVSEEPKPVLSPPPPVREATPTPIRKPPVAPAGTQTLEIEATQLTWVVVQSDEDAPNEALLQPGQRMTWEAKEQFLLTLGNAAGVVVKLNGEAKGPFGKPGQVIRNIRLKP